MARNIQEEQRPRINLQFISEDVANPALRQTHEHTYIHDWQHFIGSLRNETLSR
jgi:hypothetical protein